MYRKFISYLLSAILILTLSCGCSAQEEAKEPAHSSPGSAVEGADNSSHNAVTSSQEEDTPDTVTFTAQDMEGNTVSSDVLSGTRLTMINVWATYCNPCLREMPGLGELAGEYEATDFQLIGIVSDVQEGAKESVIEKAESLIEQTNAAYPHLLLNESLYNALLTEVTAVPTTFFLDKEGRILDTVVGSMAKVDWKEIIDGLLEEL